MVSLISDLFTTKSRGAATGVLHFGVYLGFGLSQGLGIYLTRANVLGLGWRPVYVGAGLPGLLLAFLLLAVPDPREGHHRKLMATIHEENICLQMKPEKNNLDNSSRSFSEDMSSLVGTMCSPLMLILLLAAATRYPLFHSPPFHRHCAGFTWAYNARLYFLSYYPEAEVGPTPFPFN